MSTFSRKTFPVAVILTIAGSFLPWQRNGDFISYWTYGVQIYPSMEDNGGLLIVLLTSLVILLFFLPSNFIEKTAACNIFVGLLLVFISTFHIGKLLIIRSNAIGVVGLPTIQIGLIMVFMGSILFLLSAVSNLKLQNNRLH